MILTSIRFSSFLPPRVHYLLESIDWCEPERLDRSEGLYSPIICDIRHWWLLVGNICQHLLSKLSVLSLCRCWEKWCDWDYFTHGICQHSALLAPGPDQARPRCYLWDLVPARRGRRWPEWVMRWKWAPPPCPAPAWTLLPNFLIPFSWSRDEISARLMSHLISMTQCPIYALLCWNAVGGYYLLSRGYLDVERGKCLYRQISSGKEFWVWQHPIRDQRSEIQKRFIKMAGQG